MKNDVRYARKEVRVKVVKFDKPVVSKYGVMADNCALHFTDNEIEALVVGTACCCLLRNGTGNI